MDNASLMHVLDCKEHLSDDFTDFPFRRFELLCERNPLCSLHYEKNVEFVSEGSVSLNNVGMFDSFECFKFNKKLFFHAILVNGRFEYLFDSIDDSCFLMPVII